MECGTAGTDTELLSGVVSEEPEEPDEATSVAVLTASLAEARAAERRKVAMSLNCIVAAGLKDV